MNKHIVDYLDKYLKLSKPDFAVMIKGEWGSGKTYFIKKYIADIEVLRKKYCYVSLNGILNKTDIIAQLLSCKLYGKIGNWISRIGKTFSGTFPYVNMNVGDLLRTEDFRSLLKDNIIILDDFERCKIDRCELLGYMSEFVEQQNLHVIIIADESKIVCKNQDDDNASDSNVDNEYWQRKEKIIGKTLELVADDRAIIPEVIQSVDSAVIKELLIENTKNILLLLEKLKKYIHKEQTNYRIIKHIFREFCFAFENIINGINTKEDQKTVFDELFTRFFVMAYCLQSSFLTIEEIKTCIKYFLLDEEKNEKTTCFRENFPFCTGDTFIDSEIWINVFKHKPINSSDLIEHIYNRIKPDIPNWEKLWHFHDMDDSDIDTVNNAVMKEISEQKYQNPFEILHIFMILVNMSKKGFTDTPISEIVSDAKRYLDSLGNDLSWNDVSADINFHWESYGGYGFHDEGSAEFKEITEYLETKLQKKCKLNRATKYQDFINDITDGERAYVKICSPEYQRADIFSDSNPQKLWDKLVKLKTKAFNEITHYLVRDVVSHHLSYKKYTQQIGFWKQIISFGEKFLEEHPNDNKAKCLHLKEDFLPELRKMVANCAKQQSK